MSLWALGVGTSGLSELDGDWAGRYFCRRFLLVEIDNDYQFQLSKPTLYNLPPLSRGRVFVISDSDGIQPAQYRPNRAGGDERGGG